MSAACVHGVGARGGNKDRKRGVLRVRRSGVTWVGGESRAPELHCFVSHCLAQRENGAKAPQKRRRTSQRWREIGTTSRVRAADDGRRARARARARAREATTTAAGRARHGRADALPAAGIRARALDPGRTRCDLRRCRRSDGEALRACGRPVHAEEPARARLGLQSPRDRTMTSGRGVGSADRWLQRRLGRRPCHRTEASAAGERGRAVRPHRSVAGEQ